VFLEQHSQGNQYGKFIGNRLVEEHVRGNEQATETELVETGVSFAVLPSLLKFRSSRELQFELQRDLVQPKESSR
jgi:hypothetical protein